MPVDVLVVVPTFNERENLADLGAAVLAHDVALLVVDDNSPDGTGALADELADGKRFHVLHRAAKEGLGPAYSAGFAWGLEHGAGVICQMDADFSHDPADLPRLIAAIEAGAQAVIGSRYVPGGGVRDWPLQRRVLSRGGNLYARTMLGLGVRDLTGGYRAYTAAAMRQLAPWTCEASGYGFQIEMAWRAAASGLVVQEVPIVFRDRVRGDSKMNAAIALEAVRLVTAWGLGRLRGRLPWQAEPV